MELTSGPIFADPKNGLLSVLDNLFSEQQSRGMLVKSHNCLFLDDVRKNYGVPDDQHQDLYWFFEASRVFSGHYLGSTYHNTI